MLYVLIWGVQFLLRVHPYVVLKIIGPLLLGGLSISFLKFLEKGLKLESKMALTGTLIFIFQLAVLRESWDRFRTVLGLIFFLATLCAFKRNTRYKWLFVGVFSSLTALSREYIAFLLFVTVLGFLIFERKDLKATILALMPAFLIFSTMAINIFSSWDRWWSYVEYGYTLENHLWVVQDVLSIFVLCFLPLLPFVVKGFRRDSLFDPMVVWLVVGSVSVLVNPWYAVPAYQRWIVLLVFPFSVYALKGLERFKLFEKRNLWKLFAIVSVFTLIGIGYSSGMFSYVVLPNSWIPTNLAQSSVEWEQIDDVKDVLKWLDEHAEVDSAVLTEERFYGWTLIYLKRANEDIMVVPYAANSAPYHTLQGIREDGFQLIYLIWLSSSDLEGFNTTYSVNTITLFKYEQ